MQSRRSGFTNSATVIAGIAASVLSCGDGAVEPAPPPPAPVATTMTVNPASATLTALDETARFTAEVRDQNGQVMAGASVAWASSDASVATVDASGLVTAVANGSATIKATVGSISGTAGVTVAEVTVENPDRAVLVAFYNATDGPNWVNSENWLTDAPLEQWYGVSTDASGRVVSLRLEHSEGGTVASFGLVGPIPPELGSLINLETLVLPFSTLKGRIPRELGNLTNLRRLQLDANTLTGPIPPELGKLTNLEYLNLHGNGLSGSIPPELGDLANLRFLSVAENALTGPIPPELGKLSNLTTLLAWRNELSGSIPRELGDLANLEDLGLEQNQLTGSIPPELGQLVELEDLWLSENTLTGSIPSELGNLTQLIGLFLDDNKLTGLIPRELGNLNRLRGLGLGWNDLTGPIPPELGNLRALEDLTLTSNRLSGPIPSELGNFAELKRIRLDNNQLTGSLPLTFLALRNLTTLGCRGAISGACVPATDEFRAWVREVQARGNVQNAVDMPFCDEIDAEALKRLYDAATGTGWTLSAGWLEDENMDRWHGVRTDSIGRVSSIDLSGNGLSGHLPDALGHLTGMTKLGIADNDISGRMPLSLTEVPLEEFNYGGTSLCAPDHAAFRNWLDGIPRHAGTGELCPPLTDREILERFHNNTFGHSGVIPGWLTSAPLAEWQGVKTDAAGRVVELRLPSGGLSGSLTGELAELAELRVLDLSGNALVGPIPPELGDLHRLEELHLEWNQLHGGIPRELGRLSELRTLNIGSNLLSGPIPSELGDLHRLEELHLEWNQLLGEIPNELGRLSELRILNLGSNLLSGPIPPELGALSRLTRLQAQGNLLSGSIPSSFGRLAEAEVIDLSDNQLDGHIPPQLGELSRLSELNLSDNRLTGAIPGEIGELDHLHVLRLFDNNLTGSIPAELGSLANLTILNLGDNQLAGSIPAELGALADLATLNLGNNELSGPLPAELANAGGLEDLDLRSNELTGPVPPEFGNFVLLRSLILADNGGLAGPLPAGITALGRLERFMAGGTGVCRPAGTDFDAWFRAIADRRLVACERGAGVYLTQAVQSWDDPVPLLAAKPALLRVFVAAANAGTAMMPDVNATFFVDGAERHTVTIASNGQTIPATVTDAEGDLALSANAEIPAEVIVPGLEMVIEVDPEGTLDAALGLTRRIPESGRLPVDVRRVPSFHLTLVPLLWEEDPDSSLAATVSQMAADPGGHELLRGVRAVLPQAGIDVAARQPVMTSWVDMGRLLSQVDAMRLMEGGSGHWMGIFGHRGAVGSAHSPGLASVSFPDARIIAHELGHNLDLLHAPCSNPFSVDPWFPHVSGSIGAWGYDFERDALVIPEATDVMSYCTHVDYWISDYFFNKALRHRLGTADAETAAVAERTRTLLVWGGRDEEGAPYLDPAFVVDAVPSLPGPGGSYTIQGATSDGDELFSFAFDMPVSADTEGDEKSFVFTVPLQAAWAEDLASITLSGPGGSAVLDDGTNRPMAILRDPGTGQVRAFLQDPGPLAQAAADAAGQGGGTGLEVVFSRGIPSAEAWRR